MKIYSDIRAGEPTSVTLRMTASEFKLFATEVRQVAERLDARELGLPNVAFVAEKALHCPDIAAKFNQISFSFIVAPDDIS